LSILLTRPGWRKPQLLALLDAIRVNEPGPGRPRQRPDMLIADFRANAMVSSARFALSVHNTPSTGPPVGGLAASGSGLGIAHLRQRIELVHGTLRAGPRPDGGFAVEAVLPAFVPTAESTV